MRFPFALIIGKSIDQVVRERIAEMGTTAAMNIIPWMGFSQEPVDAGIARLPLIDLYEKPRGDRKATTKLFVLGYGSRMPSGRVTAHLTVMPPPDDAQVQLLIAPEWRGAVLREVYANIRNKYIGPLAHNIASYVAHRDEKSRKLLPVFARSIFCDPAEDWHWTPEVMAVPISDDAKLNVYETIKPILLEAGYTPVETPPAFCPPVFPSIIP